MRRIREILMNGNMQLAMKTAGAFSGVSIMVITQHSVVVVKVDFCREG